MEGKLEFDKGLEGQKRRKAFYLSEEGLKIVRGWRRNGTPLTKIAEYIGISRTAFWGWYRESESLREACATGKELADLSVEEALYRKATGYDYIEETYDLIEGEMRLAHKYKRHMPPDTKAILSWLYNRLPNQWRSIQEPLEQTQYTETVKNILVAMKEVAEGSGPKQIEVKEDAD